MAGFRERLILPSLLRSGIDAFGLVRTDGLLSGVLDCDRREAGFSAAGVLLRGEQVEP